MSTGGSQRALSGWLVLGARQALLTLVTLAGVVTLGRLLGPDDFAVYGYTTAVVTVALGIGDFGLAVRIIRDTPSRREMELVLGAQLVLVMFIGLAALLALALTSVTPSDRAAIALIGAAATFAVLQTLPTAVLERRLAFRVIGGVEVGQRILLTVVAIVLAAAGATTLAVPLAAAAAGAAAYFAVLRAAGWRERPALGGMRRMLGGYAGDWWQGRVATQLAYAAYPVVGGLLLGARAVGHLTLGLAITGFATLLAPLVARATFPAMAPVGMQERVSVFADVFRAFVVVSVPALVFVVLAAEPIVRLGFGEEWEPAVSVVRATCLPAVVGLVLTPSVPLLYLLLEPRFVKRVLVGLLLGQWTLGAAAMALFGILALPVVSFAVAGLAVVVLDRRLAAAANGFSLVAQLARPLGAGALATAAGAACIVLVGDGAGAVTGGLAAAAATYVAAIGRLRATMHPRRLGAALAAGLGGDAGAR